MDAIPEARSSGLQGSKLLDPYFDAGLIGGRDVEEASEEDIFRTDYLAPFLPKTRSRRLTKDQAVQTRDACLEASPSLSGYIRSQYDSSLTVEEPDWFGQPVSPTTAIS